MVLWADGLVEQPDPARNGLPAPGFAARVYLLGPELESTLRAEGTLVVYLYDDMKPGTSAAQPVPREVWTINQANLERVMKKDGVGWGYNIWIPWSTIDKNIRQVHLVACYKPNQGTDVWSGNSPIIVGAGDKPKAASTMLKTFSKENEKGP